MASLGIRVNRYDTNTLFFGTFRLFSTLLHLKWIHWGSNKRYEEFLKDMNCIHEHEQTPQFFYLTRSARRHARTPSKGCQSEGRLSYHPLCNTIDPTTQENS